MPLGTFAYPLFSIFVLPNTVASSGIISLYFTWYYLKANQVNSHLGIVYPKHIPEMSVGVAAYT